MDNHSLSGSPIQGMMGEYMNGYDISDKKVLNIDGAGGAGGAYGNNLIWLLVLALFNRNNGGLFGNDNQGSSAVSDINNNTNRATDALQASSNQLLTGQNVLMNNQGDLSKEIAVGTGATQGVIRDTVGDAERAVSAQLNTLATALASCCCNIRQDISNQTNTLQRGQDSINNAICQQTNTLQRGQDAIQHSICEQTNTLQKEHCEIKHLITTSGTANTQRIIDQLTSSETQRLRDENIVLKSRAYDNERDMKIINTIQPMIDSCNNTLNVIGNTRYSDRGNPGNSKL